MIDHLRQLAIFAKTIDHGSFRGAAQELRLSPSVVSHHISQLEERLGVALLYRSTRKLALTNEGERLLVAARKMINAVEDELSEIAAVASTPSGALRLTMPSVLSQSDFTDQIARFARTYPRIALTLDFSDTRRALIDDGFDIAIRMSPGGKPSATARRLFRVQRCLVVSAAYAEARGPVQHPQDLVAWDWLGLAPVQNIPVRFRHASGEVVTLKTEPRLLTNDAQAFYRLARAGLGLASVPEYLATQDVAAGRVVCVLPEWQLTPLDVFAHWPANAPKHGLIHLALDALSRGQ